MTTRTPTEPQVMCGITRSYNFPDNKRICLRILISKWVFNLSIMVRRQNLIKSFSNSDFISRARLKDIKIYLGEYDTQNTGKFVEIYPEELHKVTKKILHPHFEFRLTQPDRYSA